MQVFGCLNWSAFCDDLGVIQVAEFIIKNAGEYQGPLSSTAVDPFTGKSTSLLTVLMLENYDCLALEKTVTVLGHLVAYS